MEGAITEGMSMLTQQGVAIAVLALTNICTGCLVWLLLKDAKAERQKVLDALTANTQVISTFTEVMRHANS